MSLEFCVALMLILLGALNLRRDSFARSKVATADSGHDSVHQHTHLHGDYVHSHPHGHEPATHGHRRRRRSASEAGSLVWQLEVLPSRCARSIIGTVHGLAGSAAVALLVLPIIHDPIWAMAYLADLRRRRHRRHDADHGRDRSAGFLFDAISVPAPSPWHGGRRAQSRSSGCFLVYQIGFVDGLFSDSRDQGSRPRARMIAGLVRTPAGITDCVPVETSA